MLARLGNLLSDLLHTAVKSSADSGEVDVCAEMCIKWVVQIAQPV